MYQAVNIQNFRNAFQAYGRQDQFSYSALEEIFEYLEQYEEDTGEIIELDVIAICCEFNEADLDEINQNYGKSFESLDEANEWLVEQTSIVGYTENTIIYQAF